MRGRIIDTSLKIHIKCNECGNIFSHYKSSRNRNIFCSKKCFYNNRHRKDTSTVTELYNEGLSINKISEVIKMGHERVRSILLSKNVKLRIIKKSFDISKDELFDLYINKKMSALQISKKLKTNKRYILHKLKKCEVPIRTREEWQNLPDIKKQTSDRLKLLWKDPKYRDRKIKSMSGSKNPNFNGKLWKNQAYREKQIQKMKQIWANNPERRKRQSEKTTNINNIRWLNSDARKEMSKIHKLLWENPEYRERQIRRLKDSWQDEEFRQKRISSMIQGRFKRPTAPEKKFSDLNKLHNFGFEYVGNGRSVIKGKCPDFINEELKQVVLINGIYWHLLKFLKENPDLTRENIEKVEKEPYKKAGYSVLTIWEDEFDNIEKLTEKVRNFVQREEKFLEYEVKCVIGV